MPNVAAEGKTESAPSDATLRKELGLVEACGANILNMVGIGPFITIPLALTAMGGPQVLLAWILGAALSVCDGLVWAELGAATLISAYDYGGYYNICLVGGEVRRPERVIPLSILLAIAIVGALYLLMTMSVISVVPWRDAMHSTAIVSQFTQTLYGPKAAAIMTWLIMGAAFASVFAVMLGYSRVTYAAAVDGHFFKVFARLHPTKQFPHVSLIVLGVASALACMLSLENLIKALMVIQTMIQFLTQCVAVMVIRSKRKDVRLPFRMPLYPLPALLALVGWIYIVGTNGWSFVLAAVALASLGVVAYLWRASRTKEWPFVRSHETV